MTLNRAVERETLRVFLLRLDATKSQAEWDAVAADIRSYVRCYGLTFDGVRQLHAAGLY